MNVNLKSLFFLSQAAARQFVNQGSGGKIINIASMLSFQGGSLASSYTASMNEVMSLTQLLACERSAQGVGKPLNASFYLWRHFCCLAVFDAAGAAPAGRGRQIEAVPLTGFRKNHFYRKGLRIGVFLSGRRTGLPPVSAER